jgi:hypothetical protein
MSGSPIESGKIMSGIVDAVCAVMMLTLQNAVSKPNGRARQVFLDKLKDGLVDEFLGLIPGTSIIVMVVRSVADVLLAEKTTRENADEYLMSGETLRNTLQNWCVAMDQIYNGFREMRGEFQKITY